MINRFINKINNFSGLEKDFFLKHKNSLSLLKKRTEFFDKLISDTVCEITGNIGKERFFICAVGGYGRRELYPQSDIDMVIISQKESEDCLKNIYQKVIVSLLDSKVEVGYAFREINDLPDDIEKDITIITSYLNARYLCGNYMLFDKWKREFLSPYLKKIRIPYLKSKLKEYDKRLLKYNQNPYILEPNIKEGIGGLRDFHYINWLSKVAIKQGDPLGLYYLNIISKRELEELNNAYQFLSKIRCYIHLFKYIKKETLTFEVQQEVAEFLNYKDREDASFVEVFMQDYYKHTNNVYMITKKVFHNLNILMSKKKNFVKNEVDAGIFLEGLGGGEININPFKADKNPRIIFKVFLYSKNLERPISFKSIDFIKNIAENFNIKVWDEELRNILFQLFTPLKANDFNVIMDMYYSNFLKIIFPEFGNIYHKMQFDAYHIYTIDIHSLYSVKNIFDYFHNDKNGIRKKIRKPHILALAGLLHDIGKGLGKEHSEKGAVIVDSICKRLGLSIEDKELLIFLVKNHLLLSKIAQRRDISDLKFLAKVYEDDIKSRDNFEYLYFLTLADLMSVGEGVFSQWKENLFNTLYLNFERVISSSKEGFDYIEEYGKLKKAELIDYLKNRKLETLIPYVEYLPANYVITNNYEDIEKHLYIDREFHLSGKKYLTSIKPNHENKVTEIIIASEDKKGLFYKLAGIMTYTGFNILSANINTRTNGSVLDVFYVDLGKREYEFDVHLNERLIELLEEVLVEGKDIDEKITKKVKAFHRKTVFKEKDEIYFDNTSSEDYTIIDIFTRDHIGLLYEITKKLYQLNLDIYFSKIATLGERAIDVFYVQKNGKKVVEQQELENIRNALLKTLS
ncbi:MAG: [protein-PII] uridylyltransferase [Proteobacteria bacterium]|nr:[protein-PII] uridylyltransferase [Pseudomonadota bacterium]